MSESLLTSIITIVGSCLTSFTLVNYRLQKLEEQVKSHNSYASLFAEYSKNMAVIQKDIEYIKKDIDKRSV